MENTEWTNYPIEDSDLATAMNKLYNKWFRSWRGKVNDQRWEEMVKEGYDIACEYEQYPVVWNMFFALLYELSARIHGGYTQAPRRKVLEIIKWEERMERLGKKEGA